MNWNRMPERRRRARFPLVREIRYLTLKRGGDVPRRGETLNISSSGTLFTTEDDLKPGTKVQLSISWPFKLNNAVSVNLVTGATIVRVEGRKAAARFETHEFKLAGVQRESAAGAA
jgi:hypothetical protein